MADLQTDNCLLARLLVRCNASQHYTHSHHKTSSSYQTHTQLSMYTSSSHSLLCSHSPYQYTPKHTHTQTTIFCFLIRHSITTSTKDQLANQTTLFHANKTILVSLLSPARLLAAGPVAEYANTQEQMTTAFSPKQKAQGIRKWRTTKQNRQSRRNHGTLLAWLAKEQTAQV